VLPDTRVETGVSSRAGTSDTNALSPPPAEAILPEVDVSNPLPTVGGAAVRAIEREEGEVFSPENPLLHSHGVDEPRASTSGAPNPQASTSGATVASGSEVPDEDFSLTTDGEPLLYDTARGIALGQGNVVFTYGVFRATGRRAVLDYNSNTATLSDDLVVTARINGREQIFNGESLEFNLETGRWRLADLRATFPPEFFPRGQVLEPLYLRDGSVFGGDEEVSGEEFKFSSCDRDHYFLASRRLDFYRDERGRPDRIVLKRNGLYFFGKKLIPLPNVTIPLQGRRSRRYSLQPQVGRNEVDGFFAKTIVDIGANAKRSDSLLIDLLQKRGVALGFQRELAGSAGLFYLYALNRKVGGRQIDARVRRDFSIGDSIRTSLNFDSSRNNSLAGEGYGNSNGALNFNFGQGTTQASALFQFNRSVTPFSSFAQRTASLDYTQQFGSQGAWNVSLRSLYNSTNSRDTGGFGGGEPTSDNIATLDNEAEIARTGNRFDAALRAELHDDLTGTTQRNGAYQLERVPELLLSSDSQRLGVPILNRVLPGEISLSLGQFNEPTTELDLSRAAFEYRANSRTMHLVNGSNLRSNLVLGGRFGQNVYGDDTARYNYDVNAAFSIEAGRLRNKRSPLQFLATYAKLRPVGYTPFQFDFLSPNEFIDTRAILEPSRKLRLELASGRDIRNGINRDLTATLRVLPTRQLSLDLSTAYSREQNRLADIIGNVYLLRPRDRFGGGAISIGARYSPEQNQFSTINLGADVQLGKKTRFQAFAGYNGFSKQFDVQQFRVVRDLHCFNLFASYDGQRKEFRLDLALKAFPFSDSRLGQTALGEGFDPAIGTVR
jgi:hypothetical protein